jgi:hypothetical protein
MPDTQVINVSGLSAAARTSLLENEQFVYIGRGSRFWPSRGWGNKFSVSEHGRQGAIDKHYAWLLEQVKADQISKSELAALHGKVLGCHCAPEPCHGDTLKRAAAWAHGELQQGAIDSAPTARRDFRYPPEFRAWLERKGLAENPRVLICGERSFGAADVISEVVNSLSPGTVVIEGEGGQADLGAAAFAVERELPVAGFPGRLGGQAPHAEPSDRPHPQWPRLRPPRGLPA